MNFRIYNFIIIFKLNIGPCDPAFTEKNRWVVRAFYQ